MRCELPVLKRCCFCMPLRIGLIVWSYIKLTLDLMGIVLFILLIIDDINIIKQRGINPIIILELSIEIITLLIFVIDSILSVVFLVSAHKKLYSLMTIYYIYSIVILGISSVLFLLLFVFELFLMGPFVLFALQTIISEALVGVLSIVIQGYYIVLVKSEIKKLSSNRQFRFQNNATDAECTMIASNDVEERAQVEHLTEHNDEKPLNNVPNNF